MANPKMGVGNISRSCASHGFFLGSTVASAETANPNSKCRDCASFVHLLFDEMLVARYVDPSAALVATGPVVDAIRNLALVLR